MASPFLLSCDLLAAHHNGGIMKTVFLTAVLAAAAVMIAAFAGGTLALGAHPFWAFDVALYGAVPGVLLTLGLSRLPRLGWVVAWSDLAVAGAAAWWGKRAFVASRADDVFAGQVWFYGWIAVCACAIAALALTTLHVRSRAD